MNIEVRRGMGRWSWLAVVAASAAATFWIRRRRFADEQWQRADQRVDDMNDDSFPASDPPAWSGTTATTSARE